MNALEFYGNIERGLIFEITEKEMDQINQYLEDNEDFADENNIEYNEAYGHAIIRVADDNYGYMGKKKSIGKYGVDAKFYGLKELVQEVEVE